MIDYKNATLMYTQSTGIKDINIKINKNEKVAIIGPNGSGKSTFLRMTLGFSPKYKGEVTINDVSNRANKFNLDNVGYVSSEDLFPPFGKVKNIIKIYEQLNSHKENQIKRVANYFDLNLGETKSFRSLSTGMNQKVKLCLAFGFENDIYILDEPTNGLDTVMREKLIRYMDTQLENKTILYCTHIFEEITDFFDRLLIIKDNIIKKDIKIDSNTDIKKEFYEVYGSQIENF
ncbi:ABC transporter ATP-binding protein [Spiroplasma helicoides]|uniref:ABC transporter ATP-binding protein n=1 Tax=Spiroplasma helicoides TaxID=216938 RepID=A0A1B3SLL8_9MOLU|nr:ABC transporter ATP-binding protein [Spiroplasma helicoides]AOG60835.1 ABC transporter ATP-binding protein [Spiroplasma helicoides]